MVIVFGSINLDLIFAVPRIPRPGETVLGPTTRIEPGGKGANQAVAAARDGAKVTMIGAIGRDSLAAAATALARDAGIDLSRVHETDSSTGCAAITVDPRGENAIAVGSGANLLARHAWVEDALLTEHTTLIAQMEVPAGETAALIARARTRGARVILNLAPAGPIAEATLRAVDILVANETETAWLADHLGCATETLHARLGTTIIQTLGANGVEILTAGGRDHVAAFPIVPVDTTGAGDCFVGVMAAALDRGQTLTAAVRRGAAAAALCCTRAGSQGSIPERPETDAFLARHP